MDLFVGDSLPSCARMAPHLARPHTHLSNRAKDRAAFERKPVYKSVLENPFQIGWCVPFQSH